MSGSAEGQSFHIPAEPELHFRVTPVSSLLPPHPPPQPVKTHWSVWRAMLCSDVAELYGRSAPVYLTARGGGTEGWGGAGRYQFACKVFKTCYKNPL